MLASILPPTFLPLTTASINGAMSAALNAPAASFSTACLLAGRFSASRAGANASCLTQAASSDSAEAYASRTTCKQHRQLA